MSDLTPARVATVSAYDVGRSLRAKIAKWIAVAIGLTCYGQAALVALHEFDIYPVFTDFHHRWPFLVSCVFVGTFSLVIRDQFIRVGGGAAAALLAVTISVIVGMILPERIVANSVPQVIWTGVLVAATICSLPWVFICAGLVHALLLLRHPEAEALLNPAGWLNSLLLVSLIAAMRWLHDRALSVADESQASTLEAMYTDALTGLPNRHRFVNRLDQHCVHPHPALAVLRLDIERFGAMTDSLGRAAGDQLLRSVARRLRTLLPVTATIARMGADDFLMLLPDTESAEALTIARQIAARFEEPLIVGERQVRITVAVGITTIDADDTPHTESVLQRAEQAVALARRAGLPRVATLVATDSTNPVERFFQLSQDLHDAIANDELTVVYQPIYELRTGALKKAEALVRWNHHSFGPVGPAEFIPISESNGTIHAIGDWVFQRAAAQAMAWRKSADPDFQVSINRSPVQFREDGDNPPQCLQLLRELAAPAGAIIIEITEGVMLDANPATWRHLEYFRQAGIQLALDDFGTGYSSIGQLHSFDVDIVKIDRSFVSRIEPGTKALVLCDNIIRMSHSLGLKVVAEGIETQEQRDLLEELGCDYGQGYLLGRPISTESFDLLFAQPSTDLHRVRLPRPSESVPTQPAADVEPLAELPLPTQVRL